MSFRVGMKIMPRKYLIYPLFGLLIANFPAMAELKIGYVNIAQVMAESPQAESARKDLEREFSPRKSRLEATGGEIEKLKDQLTRNAAVMSEAERKSLENDILKKLRDAKRTEDEFREDLNIRQSEIQGRLIKQITDAINELADEGDYDLVLTTGVGYVSDSVDVTSKLQEKLRQHN